MGLIIAFIISGLGLLILLSVKHWERTRNKLLWPRVRDFADIAVMRTAVRMEKGVQAMFRFFSRRVIIQGLHNITLFALFLVRFIERRLMGLISLIRGRNIDLSSRKGASGYLRRVYRSDHKES